MKRGMWQVPIASALAVNCGAILCLVLTRRDVSVSIDGGSYPTDFTSQFTERSAWVVMATALMVAMIFCVAGAMASIRSMSEWLPPSGAIAWIKRTITASAVVGCAAATFSLLSEHGDSAVLWKPLAEISLHVKVFFHVLNTASTVPMVFMASAMSAALFSRAEDAAWSLERIRATLEVLRSQLTMGCVVLVVGVVELITVYRWVASTHPHLRVGGDIVNDHEFIQIGSTVAVCVGAGFSLLLASMYLPAVAHVKLKVRQLANEKRTYLTNAAADKWIEEEGLNVTPVAGVKRTLAIAGPLIVGLTGGTVIEWISLLNR